MSLAADARRAVVEHPFLHTALRAGVINYTAAARFLDIDGETDAVATALRRYRAELEPVEKESVTAPVTMQSGIGRVEDPADALFSVGDVALGVTDGPNTALLVSGDVGPRALATAVGALEADSVPVTAAAVADGELVLLVERGNGPGALRTLERVLEAVPR